MGGKITKSMSDRTEHDYVLGTHDEEIARLGLQHGVWRPRVLDCWRNAGITIGSRVLDVGAGPGYATLDLAEIVGPSGQVVAVERSARFLQHAKEACRIHELKNVQFRLMDLMRDSIDVGNFDAAWCRWVASFVSSPNKLVAAIAESLRAGGISIFHEYIDYKTWRLAPRRPAIEMFVAEVMESWRASGGEPDIALSLPGLLQQNGFRIRRMNPIVFAVTPRDYVWQWPSTFIESGLHRLLELERVDARWVDSVRREFLEAQADPATVMITPMVLEIIAERGD
jgi:SAM-dependent methyltransferase